MLMLIYDIEQLLIHLHRTSDDPDVIEFITRIWGGVNSLEDALKYWNLNHNAPENVDAYQLGIENLTKENIRYTPKLNANLTFKLQSYCLNLMSELGEFTNIIYKEYIRDGEYTSYEDMVKIKQNLIKEAGDILAMLSLVLGVLEINLSDCILENMEKLNSRLKRGTLKGSGDNR